MYAIIRDSGKQFKVEEGQNLEIDFRDAEPGSKIEFETVLAVSNDDGLKLGSPSLEGATVTAEVVETVKGPKLTVVKFRRRKNSKRKTGHRQKYTTVKIEKINA
ncbi:MAG: 50S ribosomal protein L21 [Planctomycetota bacterium]|jgi:large subunit ribosomal protein L21|nr:50S ribosomal protein L21 [Planctomycetota bacterium]